MNEDTVLELYCSECGNVCVIQVNPYINAIEIQCKKCFHTATISGIQENDDSRLEVTPK